MKKIRLSKADAQCAEVLELGKDMAALPPGLEFQNKLLEALVLVFEERHSSTYGKAL